MKSCWIAAAALGLIAWPTGSSAYTGGAYPAQENDPQQQSQASASALSPSNPAQGEPAGANAAGTAAQSKNTYLLIELSKTLKASKLKPGDKVKAEVSQDVVSHGKIIIPV